MGGVAFDTTSARGKFIPADAPCSLIPSPAGIKKLTHLHPTLFDTITLPVIDDKSKTGAFGKSIVCLQTVWFITQCLARLAQSLPISLLEVGQTQLVFLAQELNEAAQHDRSLPLLLGYLWAVVA